MFNKSADTVYDDDDRLYAGIDWANAPEGESSASITITSYAGETPVTSKTIAVELSNTVAVLDEKTYAEANGYVSIEAENYTNKTENNGYTWKIERDLGRSGDSVKIYPNLADSVSTPNASNSTYLEYKVYFTHAGTFPLDVYRLPTLNERGTMKFAVGVDDGQIKTLSGTNKTSTASNGFNAWGYGVLSNNETISTTITIAQPGYHTIRLYNVDPGIVIDKLVITTDTDLHCFLLGSAGKL